MESSDLVAQASDESPIQDENFPILPPKKRKALTECVKEVRKETSTPLELGENEGEMSSTKNLNSFSVIQVTNDHTFFTCRHCFITLTKESAALEHFCQVKAEDCENKEFKNMKDNSKKAIPPLKLRLFSVRSGLFICYLCGTPYNDKKKLIKHLKEHFSRGNEKNEQKNFGKKNQKSKERKKGVNSCKKNTPIKKIRKNQKIIKKKKRSSVPQKKGRNEPNAEGENLQFATCSKYLEDQNSSATPLPAEQTTNPTTQNNESTATENIETILILNSSAEEENAVTTETNIESAPEIIIEEEQLEDLKDGKNNLGNSVEIPTTLDNDSTSDEITVIEVIDHKISNTFLTCISCDKIFATKNSLIIHQNKHLKEYLKVTSPSK